jgi:putative Mg2+ transporter-C (MgtC) family protein
MPVDLTWQAIALRLVLTVAAGALLGIDRSRHSHPAGLRTTLLVTLAASVAMIQMNLLLGVGGKHPDSFSVMDIMRLPLGILTGVGFIGAGAIVRRDNIVLGVTTAATMWFATVIGLCMGGGQVILGSVATVLGVTVLWGMHSLDAMLHRRQRASLSVTMQGNALSESQMRSLLVSSGLHLKTMAVVRSVAEDRVTFQCDVHWSSAKDVDRTPPLLEELAHRPGLLTVSWKPSGSSSA